MKRLNIASGLNLLLVAFATLTAIIVVTFTYLHRQSLAHSAQLTSATLTRLEAATDFQTTMDRIHGDVQNSFA